MAIVKLTIWKQSTVGEQTSPTTEVCGNSALVENIVPAIPTPVEGESWCWVHWTKNIITMGGAMVRVRGSVDELLTAFNGT